MLIKSASSRLIKKEFPSIRKKLWKEYFWSQKFLFAHYRRCANKYLKKYIESQGYKKMVKKKLKSRISLILKKRQ